MSGADDPADVIYASTCESVWAPIAGLKSVRNLAFPSLRRTYDSLWPGLTRKFLISHKTRAVQQFYECIQYIFSYNF